MSSFAIRDVRAVTPAEVVHDAVVVCEDGLITAVQPGGPWPSGALDGRGVLCLPGLVDSHSDGLEKELEPRPGVRFPESYALHSFEGRVRAAGVTTVFHGVAFEESPRHDRSIAQSGRLRDVIGDRQVEQARLVDHRVLYRLDARDPQGFDALVARLGTDEHCGALPLVSFEDHTPGQGQFADTEVFSAHLQAARGLDADEANAHIAALIAARDELLDQRQRALPWLTEQVSRRAIRLLAHDPTSAADIAEIAAWGASVAEFPTTVEAARAARERDLPTVMGAPNVLRGRSHSGNVGAEELVHLGLCSALASDYLPSSLLAAAFQLAGRGATSLPAAVALVTSGPAEVVGLADRGRIEVGQRADLLLVDDDGAWPTLRAVMRPDDHVPALATSR